MPAKQRHHSTEKLPELIRRLIKIITPAGGIVYDPTMGSGSVGEAAVAMVYRFIGIDLDKHNYDVASSRISAAAAATRPPRPCMVRPTHYNLAHSVA
ncbi:MAG: DNA methyltransferase [Planctomycetota bacterium]